MRLKHDRNGAKRTNWLLIKHRDEYAHEGDADAILAADRSVASGRTMDAIAAGKGRGPEPFILAGKAAAEADAVWHGSKARAAEEHGFITAGPAPRNLQTTRKKTTSSSAFPDFIAPQLCNLVDRPLSGEGWVHEIKLDGYRIQLRVKDRQVRLKTRKGLDWTAKFLCWPDELSRKERAAVHCRRRNSMSCQRDGRPPAS